MIRNISCLVVGSLAVGMMGCGRTPSEPQSEEPVAIGSIALAAGTLSVLPVIVVPRDFGHLIPDPANPSKALDGSTLGAFNRTVTIGSVTTYYGTYSEFYTTAKKNLTAQLQTAKMKYAMLLKKATGADQGSFALSTWDRPGKRALAFDPSLGNDIEPYVLWSRYSWAELKQGMKEGANYAPAEVLEDMGYAVDNCPFELFSVYVSDPLGSDAKEPVAGGTPLLPGSNVGGYVQFPYAEVRNWHLAGGRQQWAFHTLIHELGHAFGLVHVTDLATSAEQKYDDPTQPEGSVACASIPSPAVDFVQRCSSSIMSYADSNASLGCVRESARDSRGNFYCVFVDDTEYRRVTEAIPGKFLPEDVRVLDRNEAAFPNLSYTVPAGTRVNGGVFAFNTPNLAPGYELFFNGARVGHEPRWTLAQATANCQANKGGAGTGTVVSCKFQGNDIGYQLYFDGRLAGYEPSWTEADAIANCDWNQKNHPTQEVQCKYQGQKLGYELYFDGHRVGFEPTWGRTDAVANCETNRLRYPEKAVGCRLRGQDMGYELFWNGRRVGFEPTWTVSQGLANCQGNQASHSSDGVVVECKFDGKELGYELYFGGPRVGFEPTWDRAAGVGNCDGNRTSSGRDDVECDFAGIRLGYELFFNGDRVGYEPGFGRVQSGINCAANTYGRAGTYVSCTLEGRPLGYELLFAGERAGYEPSWSRADAIVNCISNRDKQQGKLVRCTYDGTELGYELYFDGRRVGFEPGWTKEEGLRNCQDNKQRYPSTAVACEHEGRALGYSLYFDGKRVGFEPSWTLLEAIGNCEVNRNSHPDNVVTCQFEGKPLGYELFFDQKRVGYEPRWSLEDAIANCKQNRDNHSGTVVRCQFEGRPLGYELLFDGTRAGFEPGFSRLEAIANCSYNFTNHRDKMVSCIYDGDPIGYELFFNGARVGYEPSWSRLAAIQNCQGNRANHPGTMVMCKFDGKPLDNARTESVTDFEVPWTCGDRVAPASQEASHGVASMVAGSGVYSCESPATLMCRDVTLGPTMYLDVLQPADKVSSYYWYAGDVQLYVDVPSKNIFNHYLGRFALPTWLTPKFNPGAWTTVSATPTSTLAEALNGDCSDLRLRLQINSVVDGVLIDNLR